MTTYKYHIYDKVLQKRLYDGFFFTYFLILSHKLFQGDTMFKKLENYILDNEFKITLLTNKIDIVNYIYIDRGTLKGAPWWPSS